MTKRELEKDTILESDSFDAMSSLCGFYFLFSFRITFDDFIFIACMSMIGIFLYIILLFYIVEIDF